MTPISDKPGCIDPTLGQAATRQLGQPLDASTAAHIETCLACQLERLAFDDLSVDAVGPTREFAAQLAWRLGAVMDEAKRPG